MIQKGDTVRYLNAVGGGKVIRVEGRIAYVDDDGFETPVQTSDLVVVLPAGHEPEGPGRKMFDQKAFDTGRTSVRESAAPVSAPVAAAPEQEDFPVEETEYGDDMTLVLAFEPADIKKLSDTRIDALFVNDSNYFVTYQFLRRDGEAGWMVAASGEAAPHAVVTPGSNSQRDRTFAVKMPVSVSRKLDLTKFFKVHCFRPGVYFDTPVIEVQLVAEKGRRK